MDAIPFTVYYHQLYILLKSSLRICKLHFHLSDIRWIEPKLRVRLLHAPTNGGSWFVTSISRVSWTGAGAEDWLWNIRHKDWWLYRSLCWRYRNLWPMQSFNNDNHDQGSVCSKLLCMHIATHESSPASYTKGNPRGTCVHYAP